MPWQDPHPQQDLLTPELCFPIQGEPPLVLLETQAGCQGRGWDVTTTPRTPSGTAA